MDLMSSINLKKYFSINKNVFSKKGYLKAVDGISINIKSNKVFALVGESGCGKSTVARLLIRLLEPSEGMILYKSHDLKTLNDKEIMNFRRSVQMVFQDPFASLNPRMRIGDILEEPLLVHKIGTKSERKDKVAELLMKVGLSSDVINRYPHEFSGGQRQRICIARALTLSPEMIIADEPLSALDVSIQAQIINLFQELKREYSLSMLFISHDLNVVHYLSDEVGVMYLGRIVEQGDTSELYNNPLHPYSRLLISSTPRLKGRGREKKTTVIYDVPSPINIPQGCSFHPRCPDIFEPCKSLQPEMVNYKGRLISCHLYK
ncbi:MAG TPA: dipeptide ABC transporter ATP-binding protein [Nitrospirae bacterium]|nr:dipeptide ABC transporter ATP-binding protein [Nitrospirota bacterium]